MAHAVQVPEPPFLACEGRLRVHQVPAAADNLVWLVECTQTGEVAAVDGPDAQGALDACEGLGRRLAGILNTHTHPDHIGINRDLDKKGLLGATWVAGPARAPEPVPGLTRAVDEGDSVRVGQVEGRVLRTEGHLDGHVSFVFGDVLFCGDTLFTAGCGYLFSGPPSAMFDSLLRLAQLPGDTRVCCAHEYTQDNLRFAWSIEPDNPALAERIRRVWAIRAEGRSAVPSTIEEERATNPFLRPGAPGVLASVTAADPQVDPDDPLAVFTAVRRLKDNKAYKRIPDSALPLGG